MASFFARLRQRMSSSAPAAAASPPKAAGAPPGSVALGLRLLAQLKTENAVVSPAGVHVALRLAALGAAPGTASAKELAAALGAGDGGVAPAADELAVATAVYAAADVKPAFKARATKELGAHVAALPASAEPVNAWVSAATKKKIPAILAEVPQGAVALLLSAVHFAAPWADAFDKADTETAFFTRADGTTTEAALMNARDRRCPYAQLRVGKLAVQAAFLPYGGGAGFGAVVVLPAPDVKLDAVVAALGAADGAAQWQALVGGMRSTQLGYFAMPRFMVEWGGSLKEALGALGVAAPFVGNALEELAPRSAISDVVHKACVECTEEGTVAAAATAVVVGRSLALDKPEMVCDRPFLFAVTRNDDVLFVCRVDNVVNPN